MKRPYQTGFTLLELSIVLVIIALIVGGVLVGQDLIHQAQIQATITQIQQYNAAANIFQSKYKFLPGDMPADTAQQYGFIARSGNGGDGDGDGIIAATSMPSSPYFATNAIGTYGEPLLFWSDLSSAHLIDGSFTTPCTGLNPATCLSWASPTTPAQNATQLPAAKIGHNNYIVVYGGLEPADGPLGPFVGQHNYFGIIGVTGFPMVGLQTASALTPWEAYGIDSKIDDGQPGSGTVQATVGGVWVAAPATTWGIGKCVNTAPPWTYFLTGNNSTAMNCGVQIQTTF